MSISYDPRLDDSLPSVSRPKLLRALRRILPRRLILHRAEELAPYECDGLSAYQSLPLLVAIETVKDRFQIGRSDREVAYRLAGQPAR